MTLFGNRIFADRKSVKMRSYRIKVGFCPIKVRWPHEKRAVGIQRHTGTISGTTEAETEVMEAQEGLGLLSASGNWEEEGFFPR